MLISGNESSAANDIGASPAFRWSMLFVGLSVGFLGMDFMVRRPMMRELTQVRGKLTTVEMDMEELVGKRNQVWETNNLLSGLEAQYEAFEKARVSLVTAKQIRAEIEAGAAQTDFALASLERLVGVQNAVLNSTQNVKVAEGSLNRMIAMQEQVVDAAESAEDAVAAISGLVKVRDAATNEAKDVAAAFAAVNQLGELKSQVIKSGADVDIAQSEVQMAFDNLSQFVALKNNVLSNSKDIELAQNEIDAVFNNVRQFVSLKNEVIANSEGTEIARSEIETAFDNVRQFGDLKTMILSNGEGLDVADDHLVSFIALKNDIFNEAANVGVARETAQTLIDINTDLYNEFENALVAQASATGLIDLQNAIVNNQGNTKIAFENTNGLFALRDTLDEDMDLVNAKGNLESLVTIQDDLNNQTRQVADAVDTLEVLTDLGEELQAQVKTMGQMRKSLMDIVLMEATVSRVAKIIGPLAELTNLRRMSDQDVREAARTIMDSRSSRMATRRADSQRRTADESLKLDDINLFGNEQPKDILVPAPRDEDIDRVLDGLK